MDRHMEQLIEMGATRRQAEAALLKYRDVMEAAERVFDGEFAHLQDGSDHGDHEASTGMNAMVMTPPSPDRMEIKVDFEEENSDDQDEVDFEDYDFECAAQPRPRDIDPYSGIFFSKDRREEVIEVEEDPEFATLPGFRAPVKLMTQAQWMKGCPEGTEQSFLFALYDQLCNNYCPCPQGCAYKVPRKKSDFFPLFEDFSSYIDHLRQVAVQSCSICGIGFCFACGELLSMSNSDKTLFHCSNLQGVILGVGLAILETVFNEQRQHFTSDSIQRPKSSKRRKIVTQPALDWDDDESDLACPVERKAKEGTGYAGHYQEDTSGQQEANAQQRAKDEKIATLLSQIRVYLPSLRRPGGVLTSDYMVHPTALAHLRRRFNHLCSSLLRNDSLTDMSDRSVLYFELFEWLETISNHEALAGLMAMPIMTISSIHCAPPKKAIDGKSVIRERSIIYEGSTGPRELLEAIVIQAQAAIKGLEGVKCIQVEEEMTEEQKRMTSGKGKEKQPSPSPGDENVKLLAFCTRILATANAIDRSLRETKGCGFVDRLHASLPKIVTSSSLDHASVMAGKTEEEQKKTYVDWATKVRFEYCDLTGEDSEANTDVVPYYKHYFNNEARLMANADLPKRSLAIAKELAVLTTNLPVSWDSSIFLRVDESRVDVIKALIIGPEGTPYQDGCFLFDIFLGPTYNHTPPSVRYMTTNGGKYRFNPNLYADGKVCLSLLGTWTGPGWISGKSTLLQVLISIQSMILCDEPYLNEPGWASSSGTPQSKAYSASVRRMVLKSAMLGNLKNPPEPFEDVIRTHYRLKAASVSAQLERWLGLDDGRPTTSDTARIDAATSSNNFRKDVEEMETLLRQLQNNTFQR